MLNYLEIGEAVIRAVPGGAKLAADVAEIASAAYAPLVPKIEKEAAPLAEVFAKTEALAASAPNELEIQVANQAGLFRDRLSVHESHLASANSNGVESAVEFNASAALADEPVEVRELPGGVKTRQYSDGP